MRLLQLTSSTSASELEAALSLLLEQHVAPTLTGARPRPSGGRPARA
jgi:hypothetical protein